MGDVLVVFGFSWMIVAAMIGMYLGITHDSHLEKLEDIAKHGTLWQYHERLEKYKWKITVHAHSFLFSVINVLIGTLIQKMAFSEMISAILVFGLMASAFLWTVGGLRRSKALMGLGDILMLAGIVVAVIGLARVL